MGQQVAAHRSQHAGQPPTAARSTGLSALDRGPLHQQLAHHRHEPRVGARRRHPYGVQAEPLGGRQGLGVEVVDDLHVVGDEADRDQHHRPTPSAGELLEVVVDVGLEPRHLRRAGARAEDQVVVVAASGGRGDAVGDVRRGVEVLGDVGTAQRPAAVVHRDRDRVRDEDAVARPHELGRRHDDRVDDRLEEAGVVEVVPDLVQHRAAVGSDLPDGGGEVLAVLPAGGVRRVRAGREAGHPRDDRRPRISATASVR